MSRLTDYLVKFSLLFFGLIFWKRTLSLIAIVLLVLAWLLDGGYNRIRETLREPFIQAMLILCAVVAIGIIWSDRQYYWF